MLLQMDRYRHRRFLATVVQVVWNDEEGSVVALDSLNRGDCEGDYDRRKKAEK